MCLFRNPPSRILTILTVLCSPQTTHGIQSPQMMHYKVVWYSQVIMSFTMTFMNNSVKSMLRSYTCITINQIVRWTICSYGSTTKANGTYSSSISQKRILIIISIRERLYLFQQIMIKLYSRMPPSCHTTFFVHCCGKKSNTGFLNWIDQDSLSSTPYIPYYPIWNKQGGTCVIGYYVARNIYLVLSLEWQQIARGVIIWRLSSASILHQTISTRTMPIWNQSKPFYRSLASTTSPPALLIHITHNITTSE